MSSFAINVNGGHKVISLNFKDISFELEDSELFVLSDVPFSKISFKTIVNNFKKAKDKLINENYVAVRETDAYCLFCAKFRSFRFFSFALLYKNGVFESKNVLSYPKSLNYLFD